MVWQYDSTERLRDICTPRNGRGLPIHEQYGLEHSTTIPTVVSRGYTFATTFLLITGPDSRRFCFGIVDLSGNGFDPNDYPPYGAYSHWEVIAPPYDISHFDHDIMGPINLSIFVGYDNGHVPDGGNTL